MDLKNITMDDLKEKFAAFDRKTLIKFGIGIGALILFLVIYYAILNPMVKDRKAKFDDKVLKQQEIQQMENDIVSIKAKIEKKKPKPILKAGIAQQAEELLQPNQISYYKIPVDYEIKGNFLSYIKFKRAVSRSKKMLNFDKEMINVVQNDKNGSVIASGELTIVGLPNEFF